MRLHCIFIIPLLIVTCLLTNSPASAEVIRVAVASNFSNAITDLASRFETDSGHQVDLIFGSTGKHYAQIKHGAPFDLFFAADVHRPHLLEKEGLAAPGSRFTYALGRLVLWSPQADLVDAQGTILQQGTFRYLAMANPRLAPYGRAAQEVLQASELWKPLQQHIVRGENIGQTLQFVRSGNAELGFVAYSQIKGTAHSGVGSWWEIPQQFYTPIFQQAVMLKEGQAARALLAYVRSDEAREVIRSYGYNTP